MKKKKSNSNYCSNNLIPVYLFINTIPCHQRFITAVKCFIEFNVPVILFFVLQIMQYQFRFITTESLKNMQIVCGITHVYKCIPEIH